MPPTFVEQYLKDARLYGEGYKVAHAFYSKTQIPHGENPWDEPYWLNDIEEGPATDQRTGNEIVMRVVRIRGYISTPEHYYGSDKEVAQNFRVSLLVDKQPIKNIDYSDVYYKPPDNVQEDSEVLAPFWVPNNFNNSRFRILAEKRMLFNPRAVSTYTVNEDPESAPEELYIRPGGNLLVTMPEVRNVGTDDRQGQTGRASGALSLHQLPTALECQLVTASATSGVGGTAGTIDGPVAGTIGTPIPTQHPILLSAIELDSYTSTIDTTSTPQDVAVIADGIPELNTDFRLVKTQMPTKVQTISRYAPMKIPFEFNLPVNEISHFRPLSEGDDRLTITANQLLLYVTGQGLRHYDPKRNWTYTFVSELYYVEPSGMKF